MNKGKFLAMTVLTGSMLLASGVSEAAQSPFKEVPQDHWAYDAVAQLAADGVLEGYGDGTFQGDKAITRFEMSKMVARAMAVEQKKGVNAEDKALIEKLSAEFGDELKNLGVRVKELERHADNYRLEGFLRFRQEYYMKDNNRPGADMSQAYIGTVLTYPISKQLKLMTAYHNFRSVDVGHTGESKHIKNEDYGLMNIGLEGMLARNVRMMALYAHSTADTDRNVTDRGGTPIHVTDLSRDGYFLELDYKRMDVRCPGSFMLMFRNFYLNDATVVSSRYEAYTHGNVRGTEFGFNYVIAPQIFIGAKYFWGKNVGDTATHGDRMDFMRTEILYCF